MKQLSLPTRFFLMTIFAVGIAIVAYNIHQLDLEEFLLLGICLLLGAALHILKVEGATNRSHYTLSFLVFGFTLAHFGVPEAILVVTVSNLAEWIWNRPPWFIQFFNISCYAIATEIGGLIFMAINPEGTTTSWNAILCIILGMAGFTFINHLLVGTILWLARHENFKQSGIFAPIPLLIDLTMLSVGASLAIVWDYNPYALLIFLIPAYPLYMALKIPALERKSETDQKTGLFNHAYFMNQFKNELQRANRYDRPLSIIIADLDLLRNINNTYGHLAGDDVLRGVADILRRTVREYDVVARFGGEEFAILMPETEIELAIERAEVIRQSIEAAGFIVATSVEPINVTMSFGLSKRENVEQSMEEILHCADTALYRSKLSGRNQVLAFVNNGFLNASSVGAANQIERTASKAMVGPKEEKPASEYSAASTTYIKRDRDAKDPATSVTLPKTKSEKNIKPLQDKKSLVNVHNYITFLALVAFLLLFASMRISGTAISGYSGSDWMGFAAITLTIIISEWFSISLYIRNTSLSTSAVPILTLMVLFGWFGTVVASIALAITAAIKHRSPLNRIIFNFSNHMIAGAVINLLVHLIRARLAIWEQPLLELALGLGASLVLFIVTTSLISFGIAIQSKQSPLLIWKEQYQWMVSYYLAMGFISFALLFGYAYEGLLGVLIILVPLYLLRLSQAQYVERTRVMVNELRQKNAELERSSLEISELNEGLLETLSEIIDLRDPSVLGHSRLVSNYAADIATRMKFSKRQIEIIRKAGLLHDLGKIAIPKEILSKPGTLTHEEYEIVKQHVVIGEDLIKNSPSLRPLAPMIRHHHEHYNGRGYPDALADDQISIEARIIAVADAIEAMSSDRPYRKGLKMEHVIQELKRHSGSQFDPLIVNPAIEMLEEAIDGANQVRDQKDNELSSLSKLAVKPQTS